ncbi:MAG: DUF1566 domain-containing protein [Prevotella sp.]|nr:DUF1566 domain-containing protein [Prevotella sp.]
MKTKTIFKTLALAMLMPAMLLTTACSSSNDDAIINNENINNENTAKKGFTIPVTVNVTRQGDATTRATYNGSTLSFSTGDKLFVKGYNLTTSFDFAGTLTWQSGGTFSGTITTSTAYSGTADELFSLNDVKVTLLPNGYGTYGFYSIDEKKGYDDVITPNYNNTFASTKALAVEQFSDEYTYDYNGGFDLTPHNAILNFTITGLTPNATDVAISFTGINQVNISKTVSADADGKATFAIGVEGDNDLTDYALTVGGTAITLGSHELVAGHIYNITRTPGLLSGKFTINSSGKQVRFSQGNLQATTTDKGANWTWGFSTNQWDYIGRAAANTKINGNGKVSTTNGTVDLFGWVGATSSWTGDAQYGISNSKENSDYGTNTSDALKSDWGNTIGSGWRTLTIAEWSYLFNTRSGATVNGTSNARYARATINTDVEIVEGVILFPDGVTIADNEATWGTINDRNTRCTSAQWTALEAKGCVFLPAAGYRYGNEVYCAEGLGSYGNGFFYWSSSPYTSDVNYAQAVYFFNNNGALQMYYDNRSYGGSVRLVRDVE